MQYTLFIHSHFEGYLDGLAVGNYEESGYIHLCAGFCVGTVLMLFL